MPQTPTPTTNNADTKIKIRPIFSKGDNMPEETTLKIWSNIYFTALVIAALAGAISIAAGFIQNKLNNAMSEKLKSSVAVANEEAAKANLLAAEAKLELAKFRAPRTLSNEQQKRIFDKVKKFPGTTFTVTTYPGEPEAVEFSNTISNILVKAGWRLNPNNSKGSLLGSASGLVVVAGKQAGDKAIEKGTALLEALLSEGVSAKPGYGSLVVNPVPIEIQIQVAKKP